VTTESKEKNRTEWRYQTNPLNDLASTNKRRKKNWLPFIGGFLIIAGLVFFAATSGMFAAKWLLGLWPLFALIAGVAAVMGFAVERRPRSPLSGMLLIFIGVLFFAGRVHSDLNPLQIYGRYWIVLLAIFAVIELIRYYSHRQTDGKLPRLFSFGKVLMLSFIVGSGVVANQASKNPQVPGALQLPKFLDDLRVSIVGDNYSFSDESVALPNITPSSKVIVNNGFGYVKIVGVNSSPKATLVKDVRAWSRDEAQRIADQIQIKIDKNSDGSFVITTNRSEVDGKFKTNIELQLPVSSNISINNTYGAISAQNIQSDLTVKSSYGNVDAVEVKGDISLELKNSDVKASVIDGEVKINGAKNVRLNKITGNVHLNAQRGTLELNDITGELDVEAPSSDIKIENTKEGVSVKTEHGSVKLANTGSADILAPHSEVEVTDINGDVKIESNHKTIKASRVKGITIINVEHADVIADNLQGAVNIETSHGEVSVKNFSEKIDIKTSFQDVQLSPATDFDGNISVENSRGDIELVLPQSANYRLDAKSEGGRVRTYGLDTSQANKERNHIEFGNGQSEIKLRTSFNNIIIRANGSRQAKATNSVNGPAN
jgi:DUF4097 and DUF4098 domain-containing protein YvlB/uncharacterized membrane protein HdeD (DUF308 family)